MIVETSGATNSAEFRYSRSVFEDLYSALGPDEFLDAQFVVNDRGVRVEDLSTRLAWHPKSETMSLGSSNAVDEPWLPFPFAARELAALMFDGWGFFIRDFYGEWAHGPDADALARIPTRGIKAREAVTFAYAACREAIALAPEFDAELEPAAQSLGQRLSTANSRANRKEKVFEPDLSSEERRARRAKALKSLESLTQSHTAARAAADIAEVRWRKAVVQHLLLPVGDVAEEAFRSELLRSLPAQRRAEALYQLRVYGDFKDAPDRAQRWRLICDRDALAVQLKRWEEMLAVSVSEAATQEEKVRTLRAQLDAIKVRLSSRTEDDLRRGTVGREDEHDRQRRRLHDFRRLGGAWVKRGSSWGAKDNQSGAFKKLEQQERSNGSQSVSPKSIRKDLTAAAQAEEAFGRRSALPNPSSFP